MKCKLNLLINAKRFQIIIFTWVFVAVLVNLSNCAIQSKCIDKDMNCYFWVAKEPEKCLTNENIIKFCKKTCQICNTSMSEVPFNYDVRNAPESLHKIAFLIGRWRSDFGGKAVFPTMPRFTYGEEIDFNLNTMQKDPILNYNAFAWDNSDATDKTELHSEYGFLVGKSNSSWVSMNTVMSNGFVTIEEGEESENSLRLRLRQIGRINFSHDLPVRRMIRDWILLNETHLESRLLMGTLTHPRMILHTQVIYKKIFP